MKKMIPIDQVKLYFDGQFRPGNKKKLEDDDMNPSASSQPDIVQIHKI